MLWYLPQMDPDKQARWGGLRCPKCRQPVAVVTHQTETALALWCPACGHRWTAHGHKPSDEKLEN